MSGCCQDNLPGTVHVSDLYRVSACHTSHDAQDALKLTLTTLPDVHKKFLTHFFIFFLEPSRFNDRTFMFLERAGGRPDEESQV